MNADKNLPRAFSARTSYLRSSAFAFLLCAPPWLCVSVVQGGKLCRARESNSTGGAQCCREKLLSGCETALVVSWWLIGRVRHGFTSRYGLAGGVALAGGGGGGRGDRRDAGRSLRGERRAGEGRAGAGRARGAGRSGAAPGANGGGAVGAQPGGGGAQRGGAGGGAGGLRWLPAEAHGHQPGLCRRQSRGPHHADRRGAGGGRGPAGETVRGRERPAARPHARLHRA